MVEHGHGVNWAQTTLLARLAKASDTTSKESALQRCLDELGLHERLDVPDTFLNGFGPDAVPSLSDLLQDDLLGYLAAECLWRCERCERPAFAPLLRIVGNAGAG